MKKENWNRPGALAIAAAAATVEDFATSLKETFQSMEIKPQVKKLLAFCFLYPFVFHC